MRKVPLRKPGLAESLVGGGVSGARADGKTPFLVKVGTQFQKGGVNMLGSFGDITQAVLKSSHLPCKRPFKGASLSGPVVKSPCSLLLRGQGFWSLVWEDAAPRSN